MRILIVFVVLLLAEKAFCQNVFPKMDTIGSIEVKKDPRIDILVAKQAEINKRAYIIAKSNNVRGYRLQVITTQNRDEANAVKSEMLRLFPDYGAYLMYQSPSFRVRVGNFLTQKEALEFRKIVAGVYPNRGIYVVPDIIEYIPKEEDELL